MMRTLYCLVLTVLSTVLLQGQVILSTTPPLSANNGSTGGLTFNITPQSSVTITGLSCVFSASGTADVWYRPGGALHSPGSAPVISTANGWIQAASGVSYNYVNTTTPAQLNQFLNIPMAPGQTYGICINGPVRYMSWVASNQQVFTDGVITLENGKDANGNDVGWGGGFPSLVNHPRQFVGSVTYSLSGGGSYDDLAFLGFKSPAKLGCDYADSTSVTVAVKNNGTTPRTNFDLSYRIFSIIVSTETITDTVDPGDTLYYTFNKKVLISTPSIYAFSGWIGNNTLDQFNTNDSTLLHPVYVGRVIRNFPYLQTFDQSLTSIPNDWFNDEDDAGEDWIFDMTAADIDADHTTGSGYMAVLDNSSPNSFETNLLTPCLDLSSLNNPNLEFYLFNSASTSSIQLFVDVLSNGEWVNIAGPMGFQSATEWSYQLHELVQFGGEVVRMRFRGQETGTTTTPDLGLDDVKVFNRPPINLGIVRANSPTSDCGLSDLENVNIDILHTGYDTLYPGNVVTVSFQVNGGFIFTENVTLADTIRPFEIFNYVFSSPADLSAVGKYTVKIWTSHPLDDDPTTDTIEVSVTNVPVVKQFPYVQNFENGEGGWESLGENSTWAFGTPAGSLIQGASSGVNAWGTGNLTGTYNNDEHSYIISPCFDFSSLLRPQVSFDIWYESETSFDGASFQYSLDNGQTWTGVGAVGDDINWYNDATINGDPGGQSEGWSGYHGLGSNRWINVKHFMFNLAGQPKVRFRIAFGTDPSVNSADGVAIDNVVIGETPVIPIPPTVSGCGSVKLDAGAGAAKVAWSTGDSTRFLTIKSGSQTTQQTISVIIVDVYGLYNVDTVMVDIAPGPYVNFGPDTVVCGKDSLILDTKAGVSSSVVWNDGSTVKKKTVKKNGTYFAIVSDLGCTKSDTIQVSFDEFPTSDFGYEQESIGRVVTFSDSSEFASTYHWDFGDGFFSTLANPKHFYQIPGTYTAQLIVTNGCGQDTIEYPVVVAPTWGVGINRTENHGYSIYPNPTHGGFVIEINSIDEETLDVEVLDMQGQLKRSKVLKPVVGVNRFSFDLSDLANGVYLVRVRFNESSMTQAIIKQ